jgi:dienelactone hydrolase
MRRRARTACLLGVLALGCGDAGHRSPAAEGPCAASIAPLESGFGARGPRDVAFESWTSAQGRRVTVALPVGVETRQPVVLVAHANDVTQPAAYGALLEHLASRGLVAVFPDYMVSAERLDARYDALWSGLQEALQRYAGRLDPQRLGLVGHSFGAGALPALALRAAAAGLGGRGLFLLAFAPWYPLDMSPESWQRLPAHAKALVVVFEDDTANDHRIAIDLYDHLPMPESEKDYLVVRTLRSDDCVLPAVHTVPQSSGLRAEDDALDERAVFRLLDALGAYAFDADEAGRRVALGKGGREQVSLGNDRRGRPLTPLLWQMPPKPLFGPEHYLFAQRDADAWRTYPGRR